MNEFVRSGSRRRDRDTVAPADQLSRQIKRSWTIASPAENSQSSPDLRVLRALPSNSARREGGGVAGDRPRPRPRPERQPTRRASMSGAENGRYRDEYKRARSFDDLSSSASSSAANSPFVQKRPGRQHLYASVDGANGGMPGLASHCMRLPSITYIRAETGDTNTRSLPRSTRVLISPDQPGGGSLPRTRRGAVVDEPLYANLASVGRPPPPTKPPRKPSPQSGGGRRLPADLRRQMEERRRAAAGLPLDPPRGDRGDLQRPLRSRSESEGEREAVEAAYRRSGGRRRSSLDAGRGSGASDVEQDPEPSPGVRGGVLRRLAAQVRGRSPEQPAATLPRTGNSVVLLNSSPPREVGRGRSPGARRPRVRSPPPLLPPPLALSRPVARVSSLGRYDSEQERRRPTRHHHPQQQQKVPRLERPPPVDEYDIHRRAVQEAVRLPLDLPDLRPGQVADYIEIPRHYNERAIDVDGEPASQPATESSHRERRLRSEPRSVNRGSDTQPEHRTSRSGKPSPQNHTDQREKRIAIEMEQRSTGRPPGHREKPVDLTSISREPHKLLPYDFSSLPRPNQLRKRIRDRNKPIITTVVNMNADYATLPRRPQTTKVILNSSPTQTPSDPWRANATSTPNLEAEVLRAADVSPRPASETNSDIMLDHSKMLPEGDDYKLVFISSDSCKDSEHNSSVEMDSPQPIVSKARHMHNSKQSKRVKHLESDWNSYESAAKHKSQFAKALARETTPSKSRSGREMVQSAPADKLNTTPKKFTPIQGNSNKILFIFDDSDSTESAAPEPPTSVPGQAVAPLPWPERLDFGTDDALSSMMHQTERMQAEAEALQSALLSSMERPRPLQLGQTLAGHPPEPDPTLERCRNMVLSEIRQHRRDRRAASSSEGASSGDAEKIVYGDHCVKVIIAGEGPEAKTTEVKPVTEDPTVPRLMHKSVTRISPAVARSKSFSAAPSEALLRRRKPQRHFSLHDRPHDRPRRPLQRHADRDTRDAGGDNSRDGGRDEKLHDVEPEKPPKSAPTRSVGDGQEPVPEAARRDPSWVTSAAEQRTDPSGASSSEDDEKANRRKAVPASDNPPRPDNPPVTQISAPQQYRTGQVTNGDLMQYRAGQVTSGDVLQYFERLTKEKSSRVGSNERSDESSKPTQRSTESSQEPTEEVQPEIVVTPSGDRAAADAITAPPPSVDHDCISLSNLTEVPVDSEPELDADAASLVTVADDPVSRQINSCTQETSVDNSDSEYSPTEAERPWQQKHKRDDRDVRRTLGESESTTAAKPSLPGSAAGGGGGEPQNTAGTAAVRTARDRTRPPHAEKPPDDDTGQPVTLETKLATAKPQGSPPRPPTDQSGTERRVTPSVTDKTGSAQAPASPGPNGGGSVGTEKNPDISTRWQAAGMGAGTGVDLVAASRVAASGGSTGGKPARPRPAVPAKPVFARLAMARCGDTVTPGAAETVQSIKSAPRRSAAAAAEGCPTTDAEKNRTGDDLKAGSAATERTAEVSSRESSVAEAGLRVDSASEPTAGESGSDEPPRGFVSVIAVADSQTPVTVTNVTTRDAVSAPSHRPAPAATESEKVSPSRHRAGSEEVEVVTDEKTNSFLVSGGGDSGSGAEMAGKVTSELQSLIARSREAQGEFVYTTAVGEQSPDTSSKLADYFAGLDSPGPAQSRRSASHRTPEVRRHPLYRSPERRDSESPLSERCAPRQDDVMSDPGDQPASLDVSGSDIVLGNRHSDGEDIASDDFDDGFDFGGDEEFRDEFDGDQFDSDERFSPDESFSDGSYQDDVYQEEDTRYNRPIDFTLTTILEESCEESDDGRSSKSNTPTAHPSEFEKYFLFDLGNGPHDPIKYANEESEYSDTFSETTESVYSELMDQEDADLDPVQQASQRYFTKGFLGLTRRLSARSTGDDSENPTDGSGSVGSDSETAASPRRRRKRRSRSGPRVPTAEGGTEAASAGSEHSDVTSSDDDATVMEQLDTQAPDFASTLIDCKNRHIKNTTLLTSLPGQQRNNEKTDGRVTEKVRVVDGSVQSTTSGHQSKVTDGVSAVSGGATHRLLLGLAAGLHQVDKTGEAHQSRDSGFLGSSDDLLKEAVIREAEERSAEEAGARLTSDSSSSEADSGRRAVAGSSVPAPTSTDTKAGVHQPILNLAEVNDSRGRPAPTTSTSSQVKDWRQMSRKDTVSWTSDPETARLMGRLRHLFRAILTRSGRRGSGARPLAALEPQMTRLVKTVPGLTDDEAHHVVSYLSSEATWSDGGEFPGSGLEGGCTALNPAQPDIMTQIQQEIAESCRHIMRRYEPDVIADLPPTPGFQSRLGMLPEVVEPPAKLTQVLQQVGGRLLSLMLEVTAAAEAEELPANQTSITSLPDTSKTTLQIQRLDPTVDTGQVNPPTKQTTVSEVTATPQTSVLALKSEPGEREFNRILRDSQRRKKRVIDAFQDLPDSLVSAEERERLGGLCSRLQDDSDSVPRVADSGGIGPRAGFACRRSVSGCELPSQRRGGIPEVTDKRCTLPRSAPAPAPPNATGSLSLPRRSATAPMLNVSGLGSEPRSARYRPPGFRPLPVAMRRAASARRMTPPSTSDAAPVGVDATPPASRSPTPRRSGAHGEEIPSGDTDRLLDGRPSSALRSRSASLASLQSADARFGTVPVRGDIQLAVQYRREQALLELLVRQCRHLAAADARRNKSDPYVKVYLLPDRTKNGKRKTKIKKNSLNPIFDEALSFPVTVADLADRTLCVTVWHSDMFGRNHFLGEVLLPLGESLLQHPAPTWYPLQERSELHEESGGGRGYGDVIVALKFAPAEPMRGRSPSRGTLHVLVKEAKHLQPIRSNGSADPFCKCYLLPNRKGSKQKTAVVRRSTSPRWAGALTFSEVSASELRHRALELTVWDHSLTTNELLGAARFNTGSGQHEGRPAAWMDASGQESSLWEQMLDRPGFWVEGSVPLRPSLEPGASSDK